MTSSALARLERLDPRPVEYLNGMAYSGIKRGIIAAVKCGHFQSDPLPADEIVPDQEHLFQRLKRVRFERVGMMSDGNIVERLAEARQALVIVNNRRHARELFEAIGKAELCGARQLTTAMTAAHRRACLVEIKQTLNEQSPCLVVATSVIEAGVDISFPLVMRAMAGLDAIAQAAGRCNRSGELGLEGGHVVIFEPEQIDGRAVPPELRRFAQVAAKTLERHPDALALHTIREYFGELYWQKGIEQLDATEVAGIRGVAKALDEWGYQLFASIDGAFRLIEDTMAPVIIPAKPDMPHGAPAGLLRDLEQARFASGFARRLQSFVVPVPRRGARGAPCARRGAKSAARPVRRSVHPARKSGSLQQRSRARLD